MDRQDVLNALADMVLERLGAQPQVQAADPQDSTSKHLGVDEVASQFGISPGTVRKWCRRGAPHVRVGEHKKAPYRIHLPEFRAWVGEQSK